MYFKNYYLLSKKEKFIFFDFLKSTKNEPEQPASTNMWHDDWDNQNFTLPYILNKTDRFKKHGAFHIYFDKDNIVGCSGIYVSDFNKDVAIAGVRTWIEKKYRHLLLGRDKFLVDQKKWALDNGIKAICLTFNTYNKNIIQLFKRKRLGENIDRLNNREPKHLFYSGVHEVGFTVNIQHTPQFVIYEKLDPLFYFDWNKIKY